MIFIGNSEESLKNKFVSSVILIKETAALYITLRFNAFFLRVTKRGLPAVCLGFKRSAAFSRSTRSLCLINIV